MGFIKEPTVCVKGLENVSTGVISRSATASNSGVSHLCFEVTLVGVRVKWDTLLIGKTLFIEIPSDILPEGSKESFIAVLEHAEEELGCSKVIVCFNKKRDDRECLIRTFMFLGFVLVAPGTHQLAVSGDLMYLAYSIDPDDLSESSSSEDSDLDDSE